MQIQKILSDLISQKVVFTDLYIRANDPLRVRTPVGWATYGEEAVPAEDFFLALGRAFRATPPACRVPAAAMALM